MSSTLIKFRISETERNLRNATDSQEIAQLEKDLKDWKRYLYEAEMIELEERVGFKSMERNA
jgi:predicted  nucleic acid-binding Zn-ribbon protein